MSKCRFIVELGEFTVYLSQLLENGRKYWRPGCTSLCFKKPDNAYNGESKMHGTKVDLGPNQSRDNFDGEQSIVSRNASDYAFSNTNKEETVIIQIFEYIFRHKPTFGASSTIKSNVIVNEYKSPYSSQYLYYTTFGIQKCLFQYPNYLILHHVMKRQFSNTPHNSMKQMISDYQKKDRKPKLCKACQRGNKNEKPQSILGWLYCKLGLSNKSNVETSLPLHKRKLNMKSRSLVKVKIPQQVIQTRIQETKKMTETSTKPKMQESIKPTLIKKTNTKQEKKEQQSRKPVKVVASVDELEFKKSTESENNMYQEKSVEKPPEQMFARNVTVYHNINETTHKKIKALCEKYNLEDEWLPRDLAFSEESSSSKYTSFNPDLIKRAKGDPHEYFNFDMQKTRGAQPVHINETFGKLMKTDKDDVQRPRNIKQKSNDDFESKNNLSNSDLDVNNTNKNGSFKQNQSLEDTKKLFAMMTEKMKNENLDVSSNQSGKNNYTHTPRQSDSRSSLNISETDKKEKTVYDNDKQKLSHILNDIIQQPSFKHKVSKSNDQQPRTNSKNQFAPYRHNVSKKTDCLNEHNAEMSDPNADKIVMNFQELPVNNYHEIKSKIADTFATRRKFIDTVLSNEIQDGEIDNPTNSAKMFNKTSSTEPDNPRHSSENNVYNDLSTSEKTNYVFDRTRDVITSENERQQMLPADQSTQLKNKKITIVKDCEITKNSKKTANEVVDSTIPATPGTISAMSPTPDDSTDKNGKEQIKALPNKGFNEYAINKNTVDEEIKTNSTIGKRLNLTKQELTDDCNDNVKCKELLCCNFNISENESNSDNKQNPKQTLSDQKTLQLCLTLSECDKVKDKTKGNPDLYSCKETGVNMDGKEVESDQQKIHDNSDASFNERNSMKLNDNSKVSNDRIRNFTTCTQQIANNNDMKANLVIAVEATEIMVGRKEKSYLESSSVSQTLTKNFMTNNIFNDNIFFNKHCKDKTSEFDESTVFNKDKTSVTTEDHCKDVPNKVLQPHPVDNKNLDTDCGARIPENLNEDIKEKPAYVDYLILEKKDIPNTINNKVYTVNTVQTNFISNNLGYVSQPNINYTDFVSCMLKKYGISDSQSRESCDSFDCTTNKSDSSNVEALKNEKDNLNDKTLIMRPTYDKNKHLQKQILSSRDSKHSVNKLQTKSKTVKNKSGKAHKLMLRHIVDSKIAGKLIKLIRKEHFDKHRRIRTKKDKVFGQKNPFDHVHYLKAKRNVSEFLTIMINKDNIAMPKSCPTITNIDCSPQNNCQTSIVRHDLQGADNLHLLLSHKTKEFCKIMVELLKLFPAYMMNNDLIYKRQFTTQYNMQQEKMNDLEDTIKYLQCNLNEFFHNHNKLKALKNDSEYEPDSSCSYANTNCPNRAKVNNSELTYKVYDNGKTNPPCRVNANSDCKEIVDNSQKVFKVNKQILNDFRSSLADLLRIIDVVK